MDVYRGRKTTTQQQPQPVLYGSLGLVVNTHVVTVQMVIFVIMFLDIVREVVSQAGKDHDVSNKALNYIFHLFYPYSSEHIYSIIVSQAGKDHDVSNKALNYIFHLFYPYSSEHIYSIY